MKKLWSKSMGLLMAFGIVVPAMAGPDFQAIEQARKAKQGARVAAAENRSEAARSGASECPSRLVLPLDHGPRAQTTPYLNEQRKARFEAQQRACAQPAQGRTGRLAAKARRARVDLALALSRIEP